jgi:hypothetical protein
MAASLHPSIAPRWDLVLISCNAWLSPEMEDF